MKPWMLVLLAAALMAIAPAARSGRNAWGGLVVHTPPTTQYTPCLPGGDCCERPLPSVCEELNPRVPALDWPTVVWFLASFLPTQAPAVTAIQFGVAHDLPPESVLWAEPCGPAALELPDADWPQGGSDGVSGDLIAFSEPVTEHLWAFYWFTVTSDRTGSYFMTATYPNTDEAKFVDDGNPPVEDLIENFGRAEWLDWGYNECPYFGDRGGACCLPDSSCIIVWSYDECELYGGSYLGDQTNCQPDPCPLPTGACCFANGSCQVLVDLRCDEWSGFFQGDQTSCDPDPCAPRLGACCLFQDGSCGFILDARCLELHGTFVGYGIPCEPDPCGLEIGACCLSDQSCQEIFRYGCVALGGQFLGAGIDCDPNPCLPSPTRSATWGEIRSAFR